MPSPSPIRPSVMIVLSVVALSVLSGCGSTTHVSKEATQNCVTFMKSSHPDDDPLQICKQAAAGNPAQFNSTFEH